MNRREFLKGTAWMGAAALAAGCNAAKFGFGRGGTMHGFRCAPLKRVRIGIAGLGGRGTSAMNRLAQIPGCTITGLCDVRPDRIADCQADLKRLNAPKAGEYLGPEAYKAMCDAGDVDVVYVATGWQQHVKIGLRAADCGKHAFIEVPAAFTRDECWEFVETAEKRKVHVMQLENCCYGEAELLCLNLVRQRKFGELVHGESAYIHDLRRMNYADDPSIKNPDGSRRYDRGYWDYWRLKWNRDHGGNQYTTHGLGPVCQYMNINRGDRLDYLCSIDSKQANFEAYARDMFPEGDWRREMKIRMGDMTTSVIRTALGRTIMLQHDVATPRPYTRLNLITGTKGIFRGCYFAENDEMAFRQGCGVRLGWERDRGTHVSFFSREETERVRKEFRHPYWAAAGEIAKKIGGHGGMDFLMDLRWVYCLQNGLPMDMDVYDLATWCSIAELSEISFRERRYVEVPDFTRGGWRTAAPLDIVSVDLAKMDFDSSRARRDDSRMSVN